MVKKWLHPYPWPKDAQEHPKIHMATGLPRPVGSNQQVARYQHTSEQYTRTGNEELDINVKLSL